MRHEVERLVSVLTNGWSILANLLAKTTPMVKFAPEGAVKSMRIREEMEEFNRKTLEGADSGSGRKSK